MDNCAAMVESSSVLRRFTGTGVSGDSGAIAALQKAPFAPTVRMRQPRILAKSDLKTGELYFWLLVKDGPSGYAMARIF